jgi:hypothetical protein
VSFRIRVGGAWETWRKATRTFDSSGGLDEWEQVTEKFFDATQEVVHVITGQLRNSGKVSVTEQSGRFQGEVEYTASYAAEEFGRGGPHDALQRGYELVQGEFEPAVQRALQKAVERAFG